VSSFSADGFSFFLWQAARQTANDEWITWPAIPRQPGMPQTHPQCNDDHNKVDSHNTRRRLATVCYTTDIMMMWLCQSTVVLSCYCCACCCRWWFLLMQILIWRNARISTNTAKSRPL
jgi:hypothetical protein